MKKANLSLDNLMTLIQNGYLKVGRYEYSRNVYNDVSRYYRTYRKGDEIIEEEVNPF